MLFQRSIAIAAADFPWLDAVPASAEQPVSAVSGLRDAMTQQEATSIAEAFVTVLSTLVGLLKRLIGDGLVERLLNELWPAIFVHEVKDIP